MSNIIFIYFFKYLNVNVVVIYLNSCLTDIYNKYHQKYPFFFFANIYLQDDIEL